MRSRRGQYRCLPGTDTALEDALAPQFVSLRYGSPSYALLSGDCPVAVWQGADDESQIGAYHLLYETQGVGNLRSPARRIPAVRAGGGDLPGAVARGEGDRRTACCTTATAAAARPRAAMMEQADALLWVSIGAALI